MTPDGFLMFWICGGLFASIPLQLFLQGIVSFWANLKDWDENKRWEVRYTIFTTNIGLVGLPILVPFALALGVGYLIFNGPGMLGTWMKGLKAKKQVVIPKKPYVGYPSSMATGPYREPVKPCNSCGSFSKSLDPRPEPMAIPRPPAPEYYPE